MLLDIIFGLIIATLSNFAIGTSESKTAALIFGVFCALAPDIDFIIYILRKKLKIDQFTHEHRDLFHKPIFFIILGMLLLMLSPELGTIWLIGTIYHLIHDTFDGGWGIMWLYPFSGKYFTLASYSPQKVFQNKKEQHQIAAKYGDPCWFEKEIRLSPKLAIKILIAFGIIFATVFIL
ncbi:MAG TPA: hypothetical protein DIC35_01630 [Candidatus Moranbacteria bacterium]|nr:hypothetical protein [Candidatus Moranbacteria bacterium]